MIYTPAIKNAIRFSIKTHEVYQQQKRKGKDIPYITHPLAVGIILARAGASEEVVIAGILHDTIEDSVPEKKVTQEMLVERFGEEVATLVASVTETDKSLSWEERKKEARAHIGTFSHGSLLVKSADIISNASELLDDVKREGEIVFARFSASKEKIIKNQLETISAIINRWQKNPLADDLSFFAEKLQMLDAPRLTQAHPAMGIKYKEYDENMPLECPLCHWKGTPKNAVVNTDSNFALDVSCPICDKMLLVAEYPSA